MKTIDNYEGVLTRKRVLEVLRDKQPETMLNTWREVNNRLSKQVRPRPYVYSAIKRRMYQMYDMGLVDKRLRVGTKHGELEWSLTPKGKELIAEMENENE